MTSGRWILMGSLALMTLGCKEPTGPVCTEEAVFGLTVTVRDSVSGLPAGQGSVVVARDGTYEETLQEILVDELTFVGAVERAGTYRVTVTRSGYQAWVREGVVVGAGFCHVTPALVEVRLQRVSGGS